VVEQSTRDLEFEGLNPAVAWGILHKTFLSVNCGFSYQARVFVDYNAKAYQGQILYLLRKP
jgi:hypothetical protein